jgi:hypothetical protein
MHDPSRWILSPFLLAACTPWTPPADLGAAGSTGDLSTSGVVDPWIVPDLDRDPPAPPMPGMPGTAGEPATTDPDPGSTGAPPPAVDLAALRIVRILPDPTGKDGAADSPELLEILHVGADPTPLDGLEILARAWPALDAADLGLAGEALAPGERLLVARHAGPADLPDPPLTRDAAGIHVAFAADDGLRNADGGVLLRAGDAIGDLLIYGAPQPVPWDSRGAWSGPPAAAPGEGEALCRLAADDHDDASDFGPCDLDPGPEDTTGDVPVDAGAVAIVEVLSNPPGPGNLEKQAEFVELLNLGPGPVDLAGWTLADSLADDADGVDPLLHLAGDGGCAPVTCLAPGRRAVIVGGAYTGPLGDGLALVTDDTTLANAGLGVHEPVVLRDASATVRSTYRAWPDPLASPDPATGEQALVRGDPAAPDAPESWAFAAPTPGQ